MSRERFELSREQFSRALARLHQGLAEDETDVVRDALIRRFELTYELCWGCMFFWLREQHENVPEVARAVIQAAFRAELIEDAETWERIKDYRDQTSRAYDENGAIELTAFVRAEAAHSFDRLEAKLKAL